MEMFKAKYHIMYHVQLNVQASLCWGFFKSLQFIRHNMGITSQCYFTSEPNYILFTLWLKTLIKY